MELSLLLAEQILAMFLTMAVGFFVVKIGLFQETDGKVISNLVVYICSPCIIIDSFQIEMTDDKVRGLLLAVIAAIFVHIVMLAGTWILNHIFHFNSIEKDRSFIQMQDILSFRWSAQCLEVNGYFTQPHLFLFRRF